MRRFFTKKIPGIVDIPPVRKLLAEIEKTPQTQSVAPEALVAFHDWFHANPDVPELHADPNLMVSGLLDGLPAPGLATMELLLAAGHYDLVCQMGERLYARYPMDHRVQDTVFRASYYKKLGRIDESPGREHRGAYCPMVWNAAHIQPNGDVHQCCSVWLRTPIGNVFESPIEQVWKSERAELVRESAVNGDYRYCGKLSCLHLQWQLFNDPEAQKTFWLESPPADVPPPTHLNLSYDKTCNLICPSCRNEKHAASGKELTQIEELTSRLLETLKGAKRVEITGSGDPFASKSFRRLMTSINRGDYPDLKLTLMTNGLLFQRSEWSCFEHLHGMIDTVKVSVDAASPETYAVLRRGGELPDLIPNLEFIGELRQTGAIDEFIMCFVTQDLNFREMPAFVELARRVGADRVHFQMLHDWGTYSTPEQNKRQIHLKDHPEHKDFLDVLETLQKIEKPILVSDFSYLT